MLPAELAPLAPVLETAWWRHRSGWQRVLAHLQVQPDRVLLMGAAPCCNVTASNRAGGVGGRTGLAGKKTGLWRVYHESAEALLSLC